MWLIISKIQSVFPLIDKLCSHLLPIVIYIFKSIVITNKELLFWSYGNKEKMHFSVLNRIFGFRFWTFINFQFQNPWGASRKDRFFSVCEHNGLKNLLNSEKVVTILFRKNSENFRRFFQ